jgi:hypothetical protein
MAVRADVARGIGAVRAHPYWATFTGIGLLGLLLDRVGQIQTGIGLMESLFGPNWLLSPWFKIVCLIAVAVSIWRIGRLARQEQRTLAEESESTLAQMHEKLAAAVHAELKEAFELSRLMARAFLLQDRLNGMREPLKGARAAIDDYGYYVAGLENGEPENGPKHIERMLEMKLKAVQDALRVAENAVTGQAWTDDFKGLPAPKIERDFATQTAAFHKEENATFLLAQHENRRRLAEVLARYDTIMSDTERALGETRRLIFHEAEKVNG